MPRYLMVAPPRVAGGKGMRGGAIATFYTVYVNMYAGTRARQQDEYKTQKSELQPSRT